MKGLGLAASLSLAFLATGCGERIVYRSDFCLHAPAPPALTEAQIDAAPDWAVDWFVGRYYPAGDALGCGW